MPDPAANPADRANAEEADEVQVEDCAICLSSLESDPQVELGQLDCPHAAHTYHLHCISPWSDTTNTCPVDRALFTVINVVEKPRGRIIRTVPVEDRTQRVANDDDDAEYEVTECEICGSAEHEETMLLCDHCDSGWHLECLGMAEVPDGEWACDNCEILFTGPSPRPPGLYNQNIARPPRTRPLNDANIVYALPDDNESPRRSRRRRPRPVPVVPLLTTIRREAERARAERSRQNRQNRPPPSPPHPAPASWQSRPTAPVMQSAVSSENSSYLAAARWNQTAYISYSDDPRDVPDWLRNEVVVNRTPQQPPVRYIHGVNPPPPRRRTSQPIPEPERPAVESDIWETFNVAKRTREAVEAEASGSSSKRRRIDLDQGELNRTPSQRGSASAPASASPSIQATRVFRPPSIRATPPVNASSASASPVTQSPRIYRPPSIRSASASASASPMTQISRIFRPPSIRAPPPVTTNIIGNSNRSANGSTSPVNGSASGNLNAAVNGTLNGTLNTRAQSTSQIQSVLAGAQDHTHSPPSRIPLPSRLESSTANTSASGTNGGLNTWAQVPSLLVAAQDEPDPLPGSGGSSSATWLMDSIPIPQDLSFLRRPEKLPSFRRADHSTIGAGSAVEDEKEGFASSGSSRSGTRLTDSIPISENLSFLRRQEKLPSFRKSDHASSAIGPGPSASRTMGAPTLNESRDNDPKPPKVTSRQGTGTRVGPSASRTMGAPTLNETRDNDLKPPIVNGRGKRPAASTDDPTEGRASKRTPGSAWDRDEPYTPDLQTSHRQRESTENSVRDPPIPDRGARRVHSGAASTRTHLSESASMRARPPAPDATIRNIKDPPGADDKHRHNGTNHSHESNNGHVRTKQPHKSNQEPSPRRPHISKAEIASTVKAQLDKYLQLNRKDGKTTSRTSPALTKDEYKSTCREVTHEIYKLFATTSEYPRGATLPLETLAAAKISDSLKKR
ncbi:uncharacterized protein EV422DRAFT_521649 [Fimicolochytrium jonesii]|uniref:uncharacterized protein n=1 Tax=Fimicolochytrium jonesii TaxID=1396493 RepID=UPI0022FE9B6A|nr:uncharacterized protein EV422DRAFT_521649 [Fimicolochytrium jonesii]KAI8823614.1 hypothetical protein EV422DRAFT_521649 [Fimicolochytrium jonesii]